MSGKAISYDTEHFRLAASFVRNIRPEPPAPSPPITSDPPGHKPAKTISLLPPFTPDAIKKLEPKVRSIGNELITLHSMRRCDVSAHSNTKHSPCAHRLYARLPRKTATSSFKGVMKSLKSASSMTRSPVRAVHEMAGYFARPYRASQASPTTT